MFDALQRLVRDSVPGTPGAHSRVYPHDVRIAACALLVELSCADGDFSDVEQRRILEALQRHFGVDELGARDLLVQAADANRDAVDHFVFTRQIVREYSMAQRIVLAELMWQVVLADGDFDEQQAYLIRKLANLLELEPAFLSQARRNAE